MGRVMVFRVSQETAHQRLNPANDRPKLRDSAEVRLVARRQQPGRHTSPQHAASASTTRTTSGVRSFSLSRLRPWASDAFGGQAPRLTGSTGIGTSGQHTRLGLMVLFAVLYDIKRIPLEQHIHDNDRMMVLTFSRRPSYTKALRGTNAWLVKHFSK